MINIAFWNTHNNDNIDLALEEFMLENHIDIMALCEYSGNATQLSMAPLLIRKGYKVAPRIAGNENMPILYSTESVSHKSIITDEERYSIHEFMIREYEFIFCFVHLPSKLFGDNELQCDINARLIVSDIQEQEQREGHKRTVIIGDFNLDPYEKTILWADAFHAYPDVTDVKRRKIQNTFFDSFYNPSWNLYGDKESPPGTYYYRRPGISPQWHIFDQVLMRHEVVPFFDKESLRIVTSTTNHSFADENGRPNKEQYSDHFPIIFSIGGKG